MLNQLVKGPTKHMTEQPLPLKKIINTRDKEKNYKEKAYICDSFLQALTIIII